METVENCIFCKIGNREIEAMVVYEDKEILGFRDINPQAPVHVLLIPKRHIVSCNVLTAKDQPLLGRMICAAQKVAEQENVKDKGYRLVFNCGEDAGQAVPHLHLHVLGGRKMRWPPG